MPIGYEKDFRPFKVFSPRHAFHFYLFQAIAFFYFFYRFASRDYTTYGLLDADGFDYPRNFILELWGEVIPLTGLPFNLSMKLFPVPPLK